MPRPLPVSGSAAVAALGAPLAQELSRLAHDVLRDGDVRDVKAGRPCLDVGLKAVSGFLYRGRGDQGQPLEHRVGHGGEGGAEAALLVSLDYRRRFLTETHGDQHVAVVVGQVVEGEHLLQPAPRLLPVLVHAAAHLDDVLQLGRIAPRRLRSLAHAADDLSDLRGVRQVDYDSVREPPRLARHLVAQAGKVDRAAWEAGPPGEAKAVHSFGLPVVLDPLTAGDEAHDLRVLSDAPDRPVEGAAVPGSDVRIGHAEAQDNASSGQILQRRGLDAQRDRAAAEDVVDRRAQLDALRLRRHGRKEHDGVGAVRLALPDGAKARVFRHLRQLDGGGGRIEGAGVELNVVLDHRSLPSGVRAPLIVEPQQLRRVIADHRPNLVRLDAEAKKGAEKNAHAVYRVHVHQLAEVAADDAALRADLPDGPDGLHRVGDRLVEAGDHRLAVGAHVDAEVGEPLHLVQQQLVQLQKGVVEHGAATHLLPPPPP